MVTKPIQKKSEHSERQHCPKMKHFSIIAIKVIVIFHIVSGISEHQDDFGEKVNIKRRRITNPTTNVKKTSLLERLLAVKNDFENSKQDSRSIDYRPKEGIQDNIPTREELIKKLKFDLQPKASISNHTLVIDGLSVSANQKHPSSSVSNSLPFNTKLLNQLGSFLPGGGPNDNVDDIHAELQGMLFGEDDLGDDNDTDKEMKRMNQDANEKEVVTNSTFSDDEEDLTLYDLFDYLDYTEDHGSDYESDDAVESDKSETEEEMEVEEDVMEDLDQAVEESIRYKQRIPINMLNISSASLPLVGERRQGSFVRFPNRKIQNVNNKNAFKSRMRNKQRILQQQLQKEEISARIINRKPIRNRYQSDSKANNQEYGLDYKG